MSKITPLMTSLHEGHKAEERLKCIDNMLFNKCEDTKDNILRAFWWYHKNSIPLDKVKQAREEMDKLASHKVRPISFDQAVAIDMCIEILDKLIAESEG